MSSNNFFRDLLDLDSFIPFDTVKWPSTKTILDHFACYTPLILLWLAIRAFQHPSGITESVALGSLIVITCLLTIALVAQTSIIITIVLFGAIGSFVKKPKEKTGEWLRAHRKLFDISTIFFVIFLSFIAVVTAIKILGLLTKLAPGIA